VVSLEEEMWSHWLVYYPMTLEVDGYVCKAIGIGSDYGPALAPQFLFALFPTEEVVDVLPHILAPTASSCSVTCHTTDNRLLRMTNALIRSASYEFRGNWPVICTLDLDGDLRWSRGARPTHIVSPRTAVYTKVIRLWDNGRFVGYVDDLTVLRTYHRRLALDSIVCNTEGIEVGVCNAWLLEIEAGRGELSFNLRLEGTGDLHYGPSADELLRLGQLNQQN